MTSPSLYSWHVRTLGPRFARCYVNPRRAWFAFFFFFQAEDGIRDLTVTGVQTCALPISVQPLPRALGSENIFDRIRAVASRQTNRQIGKIAIAGAANAHTIDFEDTLHEIGRASCRERV